MRQWEIILFPFGEEGSHPAVVISNDERCQNADIKRVNALLCTSARVNRGPKLSEAVLDEADGLDWKTMVRCDTIHLIPKEKFTERRGEVSPARRRIIARKLVEVFRFPL
jgi:mRNA-degrading endonuclease toxin of MazEF toxin-antitoxin module